MVTGVDTVGAKTLVGCVQENQVQFTPVNGKLRPMVASRDAARFSPDRLATLTEIGEFGGFDRCLGRADASALGDELSRSRIARRERRRERVFGRERQERHAEQRVGPGREDLDLL